MEALVFPSEEALQLALRTGLIPVEVQRAAVQAGQTADGEIEVAPRTAVNARVKKALAGAGVQLRDASSPLEERSCWAEVLSPRAVGEPEGPLPLVLFAVQGERSLLDVAGELLRLGCDRQELRVVKSPHAHALLRVVEPPWFVLSRALDGLDGLRAFLPTVPGQDRLWTEVGFSHPLGATLEAPEDGLVLMTRAGPWWQLADGEWLDIDRLLTPVGLGDVAPQSTQSDVPKVEVRLSLARAAKPELPTLYVVRNGQGAVESLVRSTPEAQLENILFVVTGDLVVLRARPGREANTLALPGVAFARVHELPNLYAPAEATIEPPLRRDRLRTWLAPDPDAVTWLEPTPNGFRRLSVLEAAFRPLTEWVDYVIDGAGETLTSWARSARFDFEPFVALEDVAPSASAAEPDVPAVRTRARKPRAAEPRASSPREESQAEPQRPSPVIVVELPSSLSEAEAVVAQEEAAFLELDVPADAPARRTAWARLAEMYARVERPRDAGMAWAHAMWGATGDEVLPLARRWASTSGVRFDTLLTQATPNVEQLRGAVAHLLVAADEDTNGVRARVAEWSSFLERFSEGLDVRSYWLGRVALARLAGGDALGLARGRDRVLARLQGGLSLDRDVPRLMRVTGQANAAGAGTGRALRVSSQLESLLKAFDETPRKRSTVEGPVELTRAYVWFEFAWGFARLANTERARALRDAALRSFDTKHANEPIHAFLTKAYAARIDQALEGVAPDTPLPPEVSSAMTELETSVRYRVDRVRASSLVLEPRERVAATGDFLRRDKTLKADELAALRTLREPVELLKALRARMDSLVAGRMAEGDRAHLMDALLDYLPLLPEAQALPLLQEFMGMADGLAPRSRAAILEDGLRVAGHFGREALVKQYVLQLGNCMAALGQDGIAEVGGLLVSGVRSLRRVGLRDEARDMLQRAVTVLKGDDTATLQARLGLASGFMYLGAWAQAQPIIDDALARLSRETGLNIGERSKLTRAVTQALSHASTEVALPGLLRVAQQLPWTTDSFSTNPHLCLSLVELADVLVLGHVGDDLTLNETTRRFLDEDEYLVRRRVHRDVGGQS